jgi:hypothetical protein
MSKNLRWSGARAFGALLAACALYLSAWPDAARVESRQGERSGSLSWQQVSADLFFVADSGNAGRLARALAKARVPAGIVLVDEGPGNSDADSVGRHAFVPFGEIARRFLRARPDYEVEHGTSSVFIAASTSTCATRLRRVVGPINIVGKLFEGVFQLARLGDPSLPNVPPGLVGSGIIQEPSRFAVPVTLRLDASPLKNAFGELVRQSPGVVWFVREELAQSPVRCVIGYLDEQSTVHTSYNIP